MRLPPRRFVFLFFYTQTGKNEDVHDASSNMPRHTPSRVIYSFIIRTARRLYVSHNLFLLFLLFLLIGTTVKNVPRRDWHSNASQQNDRWRIEESCDFQLLKESTSPESRSFGRYCFFSLRFLYSTGKETRISNLIWLSLTEAPFYWLSLILDGLENLVEGELDCDSLTSP